jgi:DNA-binding NarL/FixJ family response regulator
MAKGHCNRAIAEELFISVKAVERHVSNIYRKLHDVDAKRFDPRVAAVVAYLDTFGSTRRVEA